MGSQKRKTERVQAWDIRFECGQLDELRRMVRQYANVLHKSPDVKKLIQISYLCIPQELGWVATGHRTPPPSTFSSIFRRTFVAIVTYFSPREIEIKLEH